MRRSIATLGGLAVALTTTVGLAPATLAAQSDGPTPVSATSAADAGRGPVGASQAFASMSRAEAAAEAARVDAEQVGDDPLRLPTSYPFQPALTVFPDATPNDATDSNRTISYDDVAPQLTEWMRTSNRISTQVVGRTTQGRDLYLVTVTAPETEAQTAQQEAWKTKVREDPAAAATDTALAAGYKTPIWFSANIHGNEWEGTDGSMQVIEDLVTAPYDEVRSLLRNNRLYFSVVLNPDGRTIGQRATALGLDPNRDMITSTTPESRSFVRTAQAVQPLYSADLHGYTGVLQVEPCGPPHGENYEYDLNIGHNYAIALRVETDVTAANIPGNTYRTQTGPIPTGTPRTTTTNTGLIQIPYRDIPDGWDDYPPIFTAQYAAFHGAVTSTVELPKGRTGATTTPADAVTNTAVAKQTIESMISYVDANSADMLANQVKTFARGVAGAPKDSLTTDEVAAVPGPAQWKPLWDVVDDQDPVVLPRAYVVPVGAGQRSSSDAADLVRRLLFHGVEVSTLDAPATVGGTTYPAGSYVVDLHQPLRGMANVLLDLGTDISNKVPTMYDVSAWSYSYLLGATVAKVGLTTDAPLGATTPVTSVPSLASVPAQRGHLTLDVTGVDEFAAVNDLLETGTAVSMLADGTAVVGPEGYAAASAAAVARGVAFVPASAADLAALAAPTTKPLDDLTVGYTGALTSDDFLALGELGFDDLVNVTVDRLATSSTLLDGVDVVLVGSALNFGAGSTANPTPNGPLALAAMRAAVARGMDVVGRGAAGFNAASTLGVVSATMVTGNGSANGIVATTTPADSPLAPFAQTSAFVSAPVSFTNLGARTTLAQAYAESAPLLAGHWRPTTAAPTTSGSAAAAGKASAIAATPDPASASAASGNGFVFGTSPLFSTHTKGGLSQVARALFWAGPTGTAVAAPTTGAGTPTTGPAAGPTTGPATGLPGAASTALRSSATGLRVTRLGERRVRVRVTLTAAGQPAAGTVVVKDRGRRVEVLQVSGGSDRVRLRLPAGTHRLKAVYRGADGVRRSVSTTRTFRLG